MKNIVKPSVKKVQIDSSIGKGRSSATNSFMVSEMMASQICPVCRTFTSSSNTTLNAHIDRCLSGEATVNWSASSKVIKHRIEQRKMRSMVDIYATARYCTLEDLDRRNGTNWASSWSVPAQGIETCAEERKQNAPVNFEDTENENFGCADANVTKLQISSKFSGSSSPIKIGEHHGPRRLMKGDRGSKFLRTKKKKKKQGKKQNRLQKHAFDRRKFCSSRPHHKSEIIGGQEQNIVSEEIFERNTFTLCPQTLDQVRSNDSGTIVQWVSSKRNGIKEKVHGEDNPQHLACNEKVKLQGENNVSSLGNSRVKRSCLLRSPKSSTNPLSSPKTTTNLSSEANDEYGAELYLRKRARSLSYSQACNKQKISLGLSEGNVKHSKDSSKDYLHTKTNPISSLSSQKVESKRALTRNRDSGIVNSKQASSRHAFSSTTKRFSSLTKNLGSVSHSSIPKSNSSSKRKCSALKKPQLHCVSESEAILWRNGGNEQNDSLENLSKFEAKTEKISDNVTVDRTMVLKVRKDSGILEILRKEKTMFLVDSKSAAEYLDHDDDDKGRVHCKESSVEVQFCGKAAFAEPASSMVDEEVSIGKSSDDGTHDMASCSDFQSDSRQFLEENDNSSFGSKHSRCPVEPILGGEQDIFCTHGGEMNIGQNIRMQSELDSKSGLGNYYIEVDPILIPGPPGSYLPSPDRMASEELQGDSLVTSQVQSSKGHPGFSDRDSSESPSATSTISNSDVAKVDLRFPNKLPVGPHSGQDETRSSIYGSTVDAIADNSTPDPSAAYARVERLATVDAVVDSSTPDQGGAYAEAEQLDAVEPTANVMSHGRVLFRFNKNQACCCHQKEGAELGAAALNYQQSILLQGQIVPLPQKPAFDKQMNGEANGKLNWHSSGNLTGGTENASSYLLEHIPKKTAASSEVKSPVNSAKESSSPSKSNPVLRLMGKDLMVVNKDNNFLPPLEPSRLSMIKSQGNPLSYTASGVSSGNVQNKDPLSSIPSQTIFEQMRGNTVTKHLDVTLSNGYSDRYNGPAQRPSNASPLVLSGRSFPASSCTSEHLEYMGDCSTPKEQLTVMNGLVACDLVKDPPEHGLIVDSSAVNPVSVTSGFNPRHVDPICDYKPYTSTPYGVSPLVQCANLQMPPPLGVSSGPTKWNCVPKGSNILKKSSFTSSSSPAYI